ncbi:MAG: PaaI family thioesterase [Candidatus Hydrogenedentes bacterium]|nr:PaaI family thioesterase [Candidatus Hydrogenedentota bacterium]
MTEQPSEVKHLPTSASCFVCGEENPAGLGTRFYVEDGIVKARLRPQEHHCGYPNVVHGGVVAAIMDETMGWAAARAITRMCLTGELTVRYIEPVPADRELTVTTEMIKAGRRMAHVRSAIEDDTGHVYARAEGRFLPLSVEQTLLVDDHLIYRGGEERVFEPLREGGTE